MFMKHNFLVKGKSTNTNKVSKQRTYENFLNKNRKEVRGLTI
jgi:hypothetical protein